MAALASREVELTLAVVRLGKRTLKAETVVLIPFPRIKTILERGSFRVHCCGFKEEVSGWSTDAAEAYLQITYRTTLLQ